MNIFGIDLDISPVSQLLGIPANAAENQRLALMQINAASPDLAAGRAAQFLGDLQRHADAAQRDQDALRIAAAPDLWRRLDAARNRRLIA